MGARKGSTLRKNGRCYMGHDMTPDNTYHPPNGTPVCRECARTHWRNYYKRKRVKETTNATSV